MKWYEKAMIAAMIILSAGLVVMIFVTRILPLLMR
jgi:hypothetical protein